MAYSFSKVQLTPQPVLGKRGHVQRSEIVGFLAKSFGEVFQYASRIGAAPAGPPFARYLEMGSDGLTILAGVPVAAAAPGQGDIVAGTLPGGPAIKTTHVGPYDKLPEAFIALQGWLETEHLTAAGPPWESYITDPGALPNPEDWKTEVFCPIQG